MPEPPEAPPIEIGLLRLRLPAGTAPEAARAAALAAAETLAARAPPSAGGVHGLLALRMEAPTAPEGIGQAVGARIAAALPAPRIATGGGRRG